MMQMIIVLDGQILIKICGHPVTLIAKLKLYRLCYSTLMR